MKNPLSKLELDAWYKVVIALCAVVFVGTATGLFPNLPSKATLLISVGGIFVGLGEWKNHPKHTEIVNIWGQKFMGTGSKRKFNIVGTFLGIIGIVLIFYGINILYD